MLVLQGCACHWLAAVLDTRTIIQLCMAAGPRMPLAGCCAGHKHHRSAVHGLLLLPQASCWPSSCL
jgi:hypothetical protein